MAVKIVKPGDDIFEITCEYCGCKFQYQTEDLGYRPWYPHGFVYCPQCEKPNRHRKENIVKKTSNDNNDPEFVDVEVVK